jgi:bacteriocin-like protein
MVFRTHAKRKRAMTKQNTSIPDDVVREPRELTDDELEQVVGGKGISEFHITKYVDKASAVLFAGGS